MLFIIKNESKATYYSNFTTFFNQDRKPLVTLIYDDKESYLWENAQRKEGCYKGKGCQVFDPLKLHREACGKPIADKERDGAVAVVTAVAVYMRTDLLYNQDLKETTRKDF